MIKRLHDFFVRAIREGTTQPADKKKPPMSGHVLLMRFAAARSLFADGLTIEQAAAAAGVEAKDLRHWLSARGRHR